MLKILCLLAMAIILVVLGTFAAVCICAHIPRRHDGADCLIVLGARVRPDGKLSQTLERRCKAAYKAWQVEKERHIIVCGGQGPTEPCTEAAAMAEFLVRAGVPEENVYQEGDSQTTVENLRNAEKIMHSHGFETAALVTSDYHVTRALWIARDLGIPMQAVAAPSPKRVYFYFKLRLRETASWMLYFARKINRKG